MQERQYITGRGGINGKDYFSERVFPLVLPARIGVTQNKALRSEEGGIAGKSMAL